MKLIYVHQYWQHQRILNTQDEIFLVLIDNMLWRDYLGKGLISVVNFNDIISTESFDSVLWLSIFRANSAAKHSFSSVTTWLMVGLLLELEDTQAIAISTAFHTELVSNFPFILESTILLMSPFSTMKLTHWAMWIFSCVFDKTGLLVIISNSTIPKL